MNPNLIIGGVNHNRYHPQAPQMLECADSAENEAGEKLPSKLPYYRLRESQIEDVVPEVRHKPRYPLHPTAPIILPTSCRSLDPTKGYVTATGRSRSTFIWLAHSLRC
jgi:hypothetical protein